MDEDGYLFIMARTDDIINVAGHRLSTGAHGGGHRRPSRRRRMRRHRHRRRAEGPGAGSASSCSIPASTAPVADIEKEVVELVRDEIGPVAAFKIALAVNRLPKTRSGKILRGTMQKIADGEDWKMPATIDDPAILDEIGDVLKQRGVGAANA